MSGVQKHNKALYPRLLLFAALACLWGLPVAAVEKGEWHALIIGIDAYQDSRIPKLATPVNDGRELASVLSGRYGFTVTTLFDEQATWAGIDRELRRLIDKISAADSLLIYYGGHGDLDRDLGEGWWYPVDTVPGNRQTYLQNTDLRERIKQMPARHVLLVSDSCFAGSLFGDFRSFSRTIDERYHQRLYQGKSRLGLTSGGKEPVLDGGSDGHSIFAYHLLNYLRGTERKVFAAGEMFTAIAPVVTNNSPQKPEFLPILYTGHESGEFVFVRAGEEIPATSLADAAPPGSSPVAAPPAISRRPLWLLGGAVAVLVLGLVFLAPRLSRLRREKALHLALVSRDIASVAAMSSGGIAAAMARKPEIDALLAPWPGLKLTASDGLVLIAPGPRQGLGRGEQWVLSVADPRVSRRPHCWLNLVDDTLQVVGDGGSLKVNGQVVALAPLAAGDRLSLGEGPELLVERYGQDQGALLIVEDGPDGGKRLALVGSALPLAWLVGEELGMGCLAWRDQHPCLLATPEDRHPLADRPQFAGQAEVVLQEGDTLRLGQAVMTVSR